MTARLHSWGQQIKQQPYITVISVIVGSLILVLILLIPLAYTFGWGWTGFNSGTSQITITSISKGNYTATVSQPSKSLWDWLGLVAVLAIPAVVGFGAAWFTTQQHETELQIATDYQREAALQAYIDKISELLLKEHLGERSADGKLKPEYKWVCNIARARTLSVLRRLDRERKGNVIQFLSELDLLSIVDLSFADLSDASLFKANLAHATLFSANLRDADLCQAILDSVNLSEAYMPMTDLRGASLKGAELSGANICHADLRGANLTGAILNNKKTGMKVELKETIYNRKFVRSQHPWLRGRMNLNETRWPDDFGREDAEAEGAICDDC